MKGGGELGEVLVFDINKGHKEVGMADGEGRGKKQSLPKDVKRLYLKIRIENKLSK